MDLESLGKDPIRPDQPNGQDVRYDPQFEELQAEMGKLSSPYGAGSLDWAKVVSLASEILTQKSKDITVASYLAVGLIYTRQIEGLSLGLKINRDLLENYWEGLYPAKSRLRARISAIEWWLEKIEVALKLLEEPVLSREQLERLKENLDGIEQLLQKYLEEPPTLRPIREALDAFSVPSAEPEKVQPPIPSVEEKKEPAPRPTEAAKPMASHQEAERTVNEGLKQIREGAAFLWQEDFSNPAPYRWARIAAWISLVNIPPAGNGQTRIPPPPAQLKNILNELRNKGEHENLLKGAEPRISQFIFWLDLNRWVAEALAHLGDRYQQAKEAVQQETTVLIGRLPGLEDLSFSDGTPFADAETKAWLKEKAFQTGLPGEGLSALPETVSHAPENDGMEMELKEAQALVKKGNLLAAIERLQKRFQSSLSQKEKFLWRLGFSQLLTNSKQSRLALPHLEQIIRDIDFYKLGEFDPALAIRGLKVVWIGFQAQVDQASKEKAAETLQHIAKLDPAEAIRMGKLN
jgi:type VI secretion system protein VasJ